MRYLGVDVSLKRLDVADAQGKQRQRYPNTAEGIDTLLRWVQSLAPRGRVQVIVEPTSTYHLHLIQGLAGQDIPYTVINPARTAAFAKALGKRAKTDAVDAQLLATMGESQEPLANQPPDERQEQRKALRRHVDWLREQAGATRNRLGAAQHSPWTPRSVTESLERTLRELEEEADRVERELRSLALADETWARQMALLTSIPGIGWKSAVLLLCELPPVERFRSAKQWAAFGGICPAVHESGKVSFGTLSRAGSPRIRKGLYLPALSTMRYNPAIRELDQRLKTRGKPGKVRVMAAMHKLVRQGFAVLKSGTPYTPPTPSAFTAP